MNRTCGLHESSSERDACGIGLVVRLDGQSEHRSIVDGLTILENLEHRGAVSGDGRTGDGAGLLCRIPDEFFRAEMETVLVHAAGTTRTDSDLNGLPYAIGMFFLPRGMSAYKTATSLVEYISSREGIQLLGWRDVPIVPQVLGSRGSTSLPRIVQAAFARPSSNSGDEFERKLFVLRKCLESEARTAGFQLDDFSIPSLSSRTIVYKGMFVASQFASFYPDLSRPDFKSPFSIVHQRYSTNTFPSWPLAQPFRMIAHNGEINTLRKNINAMKARQATLASPYFSADLKKLFPIIETAGSDSAMFDNVYELLVQAGRSPEHAFMMMVPEAAEKGESKERRDFHEYHSAVMESWDGPATMVFTDGRSIGVAADRNGLRPFRYAQTADGRLVGASEAGALTLDESSIVKKGKLGPGTMLLVNLADGTVRGDDEVKETVFQSAPYGAWLATNRLELGDLPEPASMQPGIPKQEAECLCRYFGYTDEALKVLAPMMATGKEGIAAMGTRKVPAALSSRPDSFFSYFHQLFAQVTNPPMDPVREGLVMSLEGFIGRERNLLDESPLHCRQLRLAHPVLTNADLRRLQASESGDFRVCTVSTLYALDNASEATDPAPGSRLKAAIERIRTSVELRVDEGYSLVILSDRGLCSGLAAVPALLALSAANLCLVEAGKRHRSGLIIETGEAREIHHIAMLVGYGASAVNPWFVFETMQELSRRCASFLGLPSVPSPEEAATSYVEAVKSGLLKTMSKMGICTIGSYRGGGLYEAVGLARDFMATFFPGTESRAGGIGLPELESDLAECSRQAFATEPVVEQKKSGPEELPWPPALAALLTRASRDADAEAFLQYTQGMDNPSRQAVCLRDLFSVRQGSPVERASVQDAQSILSRFSIAAMSCGALSPEAHETLAAGANAAGSWSNSGEGGEDETRSQVYPDGFSRSSASRQVASGRFGVTARYLVDARELQIKMAQGAKPGEGGQLPGSKVNEYIARLRHTKPGTQLISPPPHHDIYSIEDLSQLVHDLRCINPTARIAIKLAAQSGIGAVAAGAAKAGADCIIISAGDGGTGAAPQSSLDYAGGNWEFALPEVRQVLAMNDLTDRVSVQVDGRLRTGRDVVIAAILGAREFAFGTAALIAVGCIACGRCNTDRCPVGITTQNEALRARFKGKPGHVAQFLRLLAEDTRRVLATTGYRNLDDIAGRYDLLDYHGQDRSGRDALLDFSRITEALEIAKRPAAAWNDEGEESGPFILPPPPAGLPAFAALWRAPFKAPELEADLLEPVCAALEAGTAFEIDLPIRNSDRSTGAALSGELVRKHLDAEHATPAVIRFKGSAGQSFGAFLVASLSFQLSGEANDFVGKGLSGGTISIRPADASTFVQDTSVIAGNVCLIGATSGRLHLCGRVGERFAIRNSGASAVAEGLGDHGCEYMTGGMVTVLGPVGHNFGAGMTGGTAYLLDENGLVSGRLDDDSVSASKLVSADDRFRLRAEVERHVAETGSLKAQALLSDWETAVSRFLKVEAKVQA